jgi:hypothetical protein
MKAHLRLVVALGLAACTPDPGSAARGGPPRTPAVAAAPLDRRATDEVVVDLRGDGEAIVGRVLPVPPASDATRTLRLRWLTREGARRWRFGDATALDARFVPGSAAVLVVTTDHVLLRLDDPSGEPVILDRDVVGPLSLDAGGRRAVYTRGDPPDLQVVRVALDTGRTEALAPSLVPAWSPALSPDGREVVVVASPEGSPRLFRLRDGAAPEAWALPSDTPLPTGPGAPVVFGDALVYESDGALCTLGFDGVLRGVHRGVGLPIHPPGAPTLVTQDPAHRVAAATPGDLEGRR